MLTLYTLRVHFCDFGIHHVYALSAPLSSVLSNRFGFQPVVMFGGFLISLGTISTAFTSSINQMYLTIGIVTGR